MFLLWMEEDWILLHFDATVDYWQAAEIYCSDLSLKNKEIKQSATHSKSKKAEILRSAEK